MTVRAILAQKGADVHTLTPDGSLLEASKELTKHKVGALVVSDGEANILGILSERDIVRSVAKSGPPALEASVSSIMTRNVITCGQDATIAEVMGIMTDGRFRHLPVAENGKLVGIISIGDVVKKRIADIEQEADQIRAYIAAV